MTLILLIIGSMLGIGAVCTSIGWVIAKSIPAVVTAWYWLLFVWNAEVLD
jgi:hypothetical protein